MKLAHPIFSVSGISAPGGEPGGGREGGLQDGVPPPSLITFSRPSRASRSRRGLTPFAFRPLPSNSRFSFSSFSPLIPPWSPPTTLFHPFICRCLPFFIRRILIESRDIRRHTHSLCHFTVYHPARLSLLHVIVPSLPPASLITLTPASLLTHKINPSNIESTLNAHDLRWHR